VERTPFLLSFTKAVIWTKARLLLAAGADINEVGNCGQTALMHAIQNEQVEVLSWLLVQGADLEARDEFGKTALMMAAEEGATECVRRLLEKGAIPSQTDKTDTTDERTKATLKEINADNGLDIDPDAIDFSNLPGQAAIAKAANLDIVRLLVAAGEDLGDISDEMRAELTGSKPKAKSSAHLRSMPKESTGALGQPSRSHALPVLEGHGSQRCNAPMPRG
jgi:ankyrin repeat protein